MAAEKRNMPQCGYSNAASPLRTVTNLVGCYPWDCYKNNNLQVSLGGRNASGRRPGARKTAAVAPEFICLRKSFLREWGNLSMHRSLKAATELTMAYTDINRCQHIVARPGCACCSAEVRAVTRKVNTDLSRRGFMSAGASSVALLG
ncbi:MAG: hypothetical protein NTW20_01480, partial [Rhodobacterales bacterium]|nr:hypothetical protein [Rhodobacterales bacterium]